MRLKSSCMDDCLGLKIWHNLLDLGTMHESLLVRSVDPFLDGHSRYVCLVWFWEYMKRTKRANTA